MLGHSEGSDIWKISYQRYYQGLSQSQRSILEHREY